MAQQTLETVIRTAIYTRHRRNWLDPEDLDEIVADVAHAVRAMERPTTAARPSLGSGSRTDYVEVVR